MEETWKGVEGYEGLYEVSNLGNVKSFRHCKTGRNMAITNRGKGYMCVELRNNGVGKIKLIHRLVAQAFIPNLENKAVVNHLDNNPSNNHVSNLAWAGQAENVNYAAKQNRLAKPCGEKNGQNKLSASDVLAIRQRRATEKTTYKDLAKEFNVCEATIFNIVKRMRWAHI